MAFLLCGITSDSSGMFFLENFFHKIYISPAYDSRAPCNDKINRTGKDIILDKRLLLQRLV